MNKNINLCEILKDCPKGTKLYSTIYGEVEFKGINRFFDYPISVLTCSTDPNRNHIEIRFASDGKYYKVFKDSDCVLFPAKDQRDWSKWECPKPKKSKFDPKTLQPFDRVLLKNDNNQWNCAFVSHIGIDRIYLTTGGYVWICIPYNEDTKHLIGTKDEAPEYYRYWED